jgi:hypothetical protein
MSAPEWQRLDLVVTCWHPFVEPGRQLAAEAAGPERRTLLAKGAAFAALLITGCARKESRGFDDFEGRWLR